jgi:hypothetical protein
MIQITANLDSLKNGILGQTASGANIGNNPALKAQIDQITTDATNQTNGAWAAAGRDGSPGNSQALGRGIASGVAPVLAAQYNTDVNNALGAATSLYGAGNTTYGLLNGNQNHRQPELHQRDRRGFVRPQRAERGADRGDQRHGAAVQHSGVSAANAARHGLAGRGAVRHAERPVDGRKHDERRAAVRHDRAGHRLADTKGSNQLRSIINGRLA